FEIPQEIYGGWDARSRGAAFEREWNEKLAGYERAQPERAAELRRRIAGALPAQWTEQSERLIADTSAKAETIATRKASQNAIEALAPVLPELVGGSADLAVSNLT